VKSVVCFLVWAVGFLMQHLFCFDVFDANLWYFYVAAILCAGIQYGMLWINISRGKHLHKTCVIVYSLTVLSEAVQLVMYRFYIPYPIGLTVLCLVLDLCGLLLIVFLKNQALECEKYD